MNSIKPIAVSVLSTFLLLQSGAAAVSPSLPVIPGGTYNIINYGASGDGLATNTTAIQAALAAAKTAGGGTVLLRAAIPGAAVA